MENFVETGSVNHLFAVHLCRESAGKQPARPETDLRRPEKHLWHMRPMSRLHRNDSGTFLEDCGSGLLLLSTTTPDK